MTITAECPDTYPAGRRGQLLAELAAGRSLVDIAGTWHVSINTVKTHAGHLYRSIGVNSRAGAIAYAYRHGLVTPPTKRRHRPARDVVLHEQPAAWCRECRHTVSGVHPHPTVAAVVRIVATGTRT